jgi:methionine-S-sulfoxide reductase
MKLLFSILVSLILVATSALAATMDNKGETKEMKEPALARAIFAGGCFWCMEPPFEKLDGVQAVVSGYIAGHVDNPTYQQVSAGTTGHAEAVEIRYDPARVSYQKLLEVFWMNIDPTDAGGQFVDRGNQYRTGIYYLDDEQKRLAEASRDQLDKSGRFDRPIVTEIVAATTFYPAEDYHQDYYRENPVRYQFYRYNSGRDLFLDRVWDKDKK